MNIWKNSEQFFLLISNIMYKYSIFVLIGIVLFLLWNNYDGFSIGNPYGSFIRSLMNPSGDIEAYNMLAYLDSEPVELLRANIYYNDLESYKEEMGTMEPPIVYLGKFSKTWDIRDLYLISDLLVYYDGTTYKGQIPIFYNGIPATYVIKDGRRDVIDPGSIEHASSAWDGKYLVITYADADDNENVVELFSDKSVNSRSQLSDLRRAKIMLDEYLQYIRVQMTYTMGMDVCSVGLMQDPVDGSIGGSCETDDDCTVGSCLLVECLCDNPDDDEKTCFRDPSDFLRMRLGRPVSADDGG